MEEEKVLKLLQSLDENKSTGLDGISGKLQQIVKALHRYSTLVWRPGRLQVSGNWREWLQYPKGGSQKGLTTFAQYQPCAVSGGKGT